MCACRARGHLQGARASPPACAGGAGVPALKGGFGRPDACNGKWYAAASQKTCPCEGRPRPHVPGARASPGCAGIPRVRGRPRPLAPGARASPGCAGIPRVRGRPRPLAPGVRASSPACGGCADIPRVRGHPQGARASPGCAGVLARLCRVRGHPQGARASPGCAGVLARWRRVRGRPRPLAPGVQMYPGNTRYSDPGSHLFCASPYAACQIAAAPYPTTHGAARSTSPDVP